MDTYPQENYQENKKSTTKKTNHIPKTNSHTTIKIKHIYALKEKYLIVKENMTTKQKQFIGAKNVKTAFQKKNAVENQDTEQ